VGENQNSLLVKGNNKKVSAGNVIMNGVK